MVDGGYCSGVLVFTVNTMVVICIYHSTLRLHTCYTLKKQIGPKRSNQVSVNFTSQFTHI